MKRLALVLSAAAFFLNGCGKGTAVAISTGDKIEGPAVVSLSQQQVLGFYAECTAFGRMDDPRVKYTARYCSAINSAQQMQGYASSTRPKVDPSPVKMH